MPREFEVREAIELDATPEQVWAAIATGPGIDSWFMGRNEVEAGVGGRSQMEIAGHTETSTITAWEPGRRFAHRSGTGPGGEFMAFEYLVEGRAHGGTVLRFVHNGFLGDDWEAEYDALSRGDRMYLRKLAVYLAHFPDRVSSYNMFLIGPQVTEHQRVWNAFLAAFGLAFAHEGAKTTITVDGLAPVTGVVEFADEPAFLGVRTEEGLYMMVHGYRDVVVAEYHHYGADPPREFEAAWRRWLRHELGQ